MLLEDKEIYLVKKIILEDICWHKIIFCLHIATGVFKKW